ncbi:homeobox-leucine zipper protein HAT22-like [Olea europaea var. sylvestris]|uniref:homeobox-leucine zipper protein HAT22-like n=1 Tax=Olea europaea var. sylvestris TaxID=158386 RepID=UPI000C1D16B7|nr:homeobox-leucine zipper protein HAT22-like [Olea europaea var. sylvestris]
MGFDDIHNPGLVLGLGLPSEPDRRPYLKLDDQFEKGSEPSLTLTLSADQSVDHVNLQPQDSGGVSSPCNGNLKRERKVACEEEERERMASRVCTYEDDDGSNGRKKLRLSKAQSALLEESFKQHSTLNPKHKQELAKELKLRPRQVEVWFQNRRARTKLKQTEVDCEQLKKCFETLTEENRRLQKELQQLKSLNFPPPLYMQLPAATLSMCPSCERVGGATTGPTADVDDNGSKSKPHFYNLLTNPSAA